MYLGHLRFVSLKTASINPGINELFVNTDDQSKIQVVAEGICPDTFDDKQLPTDVPHHHFY